MKKNICRFGVLVALSCTLVSCSKFFGTQSTKEAKSNSKYSARKVANNQNISPEELNEALGFPEFREKVLSFDSADGLASFIGSLKYETYTAETLKTKSPTYILAKESVHMLKIYRGLFYRMRSLVKKHNFSRTVVVNSLRMSAAGIDTFLPGNQWQAGFNYVTEPFYNTKGNSDLDITNDQEFKMFLVNEVSPALESYLTTLNFLIDNIKDNKLYWDNVLFNQNFNKDNEDRFLELGKVELKLIKASVLAGLSGIQSAKAYSLTGFFQLVDDISKKLGMGVVFSPGDAVSAKRNKIVVKALDRGFLSKPANLSNKDFEAALVAAYDHAVSAVKETEEAWKVMKEEDPSYDRILKARSAQPFSRILDASFMNAKVLAGKSKATTVVSVIAQGEQVSFNIKKFFLESPIGIEGRSFKDFMPLKDGYNDEKETITKTIGGEVVGYRNFREGNPNKWNASVYKEYFGTEDVQLVNRVLSQSWGSAGFGLPLIGVIL